MAKRIKAQGITQHVFSLATPGMSAIHRAGLGGLACTLDWIERQHQDGRLRKKEIPGWPWNDDAPPWEITPTSVVVELSNPGAAADFLQRLFALAFQIKNGMIYLPGQYAGQPPKTPTQAALQAGMILTFLQHGKSRRVANTPSTVSHKPDDDGSREIQVRYAQCLWFAHQDGWKKLVDAKTGNLTAKSVDIAGPMNPGAVVRHTAFNTPTKISESAELSLPLYFALVGCLCLRVPPGIGVMLVPEVTDLVEFCEVRPTITPGSYEQTRADGIADTALQMQLRLRAHKILDDAVPSCTVVSFQTMPWAKQQKTRAATMTVQTLDKKACSQFETAMIELPSRIASKKVTEKKGKGKSAKTVERTEWFLASSVVRPFVAENLARGRPWYQGFTKLMTQMDASGKKPLRDKIFFERKGLHAMTEKIPWKDQGESAVVRAVHQAMKMRYGMIASENKGSESARKRRTQNEYDRWRLAFSGAKTANQFRQSLCDLFSRARINRVLQDSWPEVLPMLHDSQWELSRDLALLALASYKGTGDKGLEDPESIDEKD